MNMWGFTPLFFDDLEEKFESFLSTCVDRAESEFYVPDAVNDLIRKDRAKVVVLKTESVWFGVTYAQDRVLAEERISQLIEAGAYPESLA